MRGQPNALEHLTVYREREPPDRVIVPSDETTKTGLVPGSESIRR